MPQKHAAFLHWHSVAIVGVNGVLGRQCILYFECNLIKGRTAEKWALPMDNELESLQKNDVYLEVARQVRKKVIGTKWVLRIKTGGAGSIEKKRPRW